MVSTDNFRVHLDRFTILHQIWQLLERMHLEHLPRRRCLAGHGREAPDRRESDPRVVVGEPR
jgi:hypothetical protein